MEYNKFNAFIYELILFIDRFSPGFKYRGWVKQIRDYCQDDWSEFRTQVVMQEIDNDIDEIMRAWEEEYPNVTTPIYREEPMNGSEAQELLGGAISLSSSWSPYIDEPSS